MNRSPMLEHRSRWTESDLTDLIVQVLGPNMVPKQVRILRDTSNFFSVDYDDILILDNVPYLIRNAEREGRFGLDDELKLWVKRAVEIPTGKTKILKMVFAERYTTRIGGLLFHCARSPRKEARILELVTGHPHFMQGRSVKDSAGNLVRVIDYIPGRTLADNVVAQPVSHEEFFHDRFPRLLEEFVALVKAIRFLHDHKEKHGDIRRDHIIRDKHTSLFRWIDYDFNFYHRENMFGLDLYGLGNILAYIVGQGDVLIGDLKVQAPEVLNRLGAEDLNIVFANRVVNLKKVYGYIPERLNRILMHFSAGAEIYYEDTADFIEDILEVRETFGAS